MKKLLSVLVSSLLVCSLAACGGGSATSTATEPATEAAPAATQAASEAAPADAPAEDVTIKVFSNLPDRTNGQGLVEQLLFDAYMEANPNVKIEVEALDDESYKTKFKAYAAGSEMPDLVSVWGQPAFIDEVIDAGLLAELNETDYAGYGFLDGSLSGFSKNGKLYGLPRNTDVMTFFYNQKMFEDNGWAVPATFDDLLALAGDIKTAGLIPVSMDGGDKWPISIMITELMAKIHGPDVNSVIVNAIANKDFSDPAFTQAIELLQKAYDTGLFQTGFETTDYGTAMNLFTNGQAAMFYMGSWEMSMANNDDVLPEVRENIRAFTMPVVTGGAGAANDIAAWNGGGHSVTANSKIKDEAVKLLNYMYLPENWNRLAWENNVCMSAQDFSQYKTGNETPVQLGLIDILTSANSISGTPINDMGTSEYKTICEDLSQEAAIKSITPEQFVAGMAG